MILTVDNGDFVFLDCAYEELLQSLGPDQRHRYGAVDDVQRPGLDGILRRLDQYILNILYDPRIKAGMTVQEVRGVLPAITAAEVRASVAKITICQ